VIGSGPNGLAAAITLAQAGAEVLVLEAAPVAGGAVATDELTLPGFRHDTYSSVYPAAAASPVFAAMPLERHGLRWVHPVACYAHPLEDGRGAALYRDLDRTAQSLDALAPGNGDAWRRFVSPWLESSNCCTTRCSGSSRPCGRPSGSPSVCDRDGWRSWAGWL
jgi:phytoene dehydrogenase-like protein